MNLQESDFLSSQISVIMNDAGDPSSIQNGDNSCVAEVLNRICSKRKEFSQTGKRTEYLNWHDFFMATAFLVAKRSKDPVSQVGACIVNAEKKIVATGYNGMPLGCSDDEFPWQKETNDPLDSKYFYVCHAEMNAVLNKNSADVKNCTIYVGLFPCNECAKIIIQSGMKEVIYMSDKHAHKKETIAAKRMFDASKIKYWQYIPSSEKLVIDFSEINWNAQRQVQCTPQKMPKLTKE